MTTEFYHKSASDLTPEQSVQADAQLRLDINKILDKMIAENKNFVLFYDFEDGVSASSFKTLGRVSQHDMDSIGICLSGEAKHKDILPGDDLGLEDILSILKGEHN